MIICCDTSAGAFSIASTLSLDPRISAETAFGYIMINYSTVNPEPEAASVF
tara:strand:- start:73 stop:225 length:153 start_codon:yes stop_codon:yes gene_type:complete